MDATKSEARAAEEKGKNKTKQIKNKLINNSLSLRRHSLAIIITHTLHRSAAERESVSSKRSGSLGEAGPMAPLPMAASTAAGDEPDGGGVARAPAGGSSAGFEPVDVVGGESWRTAERNEKRKGGKERTSSVNQRY